MYQQVGVTRNNYIVGSLENRWNKSKNYRKKVAIVGTCSKQGGKAFDKVSLNEF